MGKACCLPSCKNQKGSIFRCPTDPVLNMKWINAITHLNPSLIENLNKEYYLCFKHFPASALITEDVYIPPGFPGKNMKEKRQRIRLRKTAVPSLLLSGPEVNRVNESSLLLSGPEVNLVNESTVYNFDGIVENKKLQPVDEVTIYPFDENDESLIRYRHDKIFCLGDAFDYINRIKVKSQSWHFLEDNGRILFYKLTISGAPKVERSFFLNADLTVDMYVGESKLEADHAVHILGRSLKCDRFCKLNDLIDFIDFVKIV